MNQVPTKSILFSDLVAIDNEDGTFDIVKNGITMFKKKKVSLEQIMEIYKQIVEN